MASQTPRFRLPRTTGLPSPVIPIDDHPTPAKEKEQSVDVKVTFAQVELLLEIPQLCVEI